MPLKSTKKRARHDKRQGKSSSTQAGEYVHEQMHKYKRGGGRAKNRKQAIAIGLSEARREGVSVPKKGKAASKKRSSAKRSSAKRSSAKSTARHRASSSSTSKRSSSKRSTAKKSSSRSRSSSKRTR